MAYIIVEYVPYDETDGQLNGESILPRLLEGRTKMTVNEVTPNMHLEKNKLYVLPPGANVNIVNGRFVFSTPLVRRKDDNVLDLLLANMAYGFGRQVAAIVMPGVTMDITAGLRVIKAEGGFTFLHKDAGLFQEMARPDEMADCIDFILPPAGITERLKWLKGYFSGIGSGSAEAVEVERNQLGRIYLFLLNQKGIDFSLYKQSAVLHRILRRMAIAGTDSMEEYAGFLSDNAGEAEHLYRDVLSVVSGIFMEPEISRVLVKEVLPRVLDKRLKTSPLRIWIPLCAGGEEACSVAICVLEYLKEKDIELPVQVFATDLNRATIEKARMGFYEDGALVNLSPRRIRKYFIKVEGGYQVVGPVREMCIFAAHNLLKDPPFSRVDIIVGQNALAGLHMDHWHTVFRSFHYALNAQGWLLLKNWKDSWYPMELFARMEAAPELYSRKEVPAAFPLPAFSRQEPDGEREAAELLLNGYVAAAILIDDVFRIVRYYGDTSPYLRPAGGRPSLHVLQLLDDSIVFDVNHLFERLGKEGRPVRLEGILLTGDSNSREIDVELIPLRYRNWRLLVFREGGRPSAEGAAALSGTKSEVQARKILSLEKRLRDTEKMLQKANEGSWRMQEQLHTAQEELMSSNEELMSMNEALAMAKLELEVYNHELSTVNTDLYTRNKDLETSIEYAHAIISAIRQPLIILQNDLRVRTANNAFYSYFGLDPEEVKGQYLYTIGDGIFDLEELLGHLGQLSAKRNPSLDMEIKQHFPRHGERVMLLNAAIMEGHTGRRAGILLGLEDITDRKMADRFKDEFIGIASHELKTPATSIQAYTQILYNEFLESNDQRSAALMSRLNSQVTRLAHLAKDLLDITKITQGQINLRKQYFDMNALINDIVEEVQVTTAIRVAVAVPVIPQVWGDKDRMGQVLVNLLSNAIKYSADSASVDLSAIVRKSAVHLIVQDYGIGMSAETVQKIFDRFYRSDDPASLRHPGLGLGLYISAEIVRRHGGRILVSSEKGKGSVFTVILPFGKEG